ncbi:MAG: hypothetical protein LBS36_05885 [Oscillospiraceae bacterium]|nr:hypothetical protein [Oscillospiraceae bacterium]
MFFRIRYARFFPKGSSKSNGEYERHDAAVVCKNAFHSVTKQVTSRSLETAYISSSFSSLNVRFDEAALSPDGADVAVMGFFGKVQLFVPEGWRVLDNEARKAEKKRKKDFDDDAPSVPTLRIFENVVFAGVFIRTIEGKKPIKIYIIRENQEFAEDQEVALFLDGQKCTNVKNDETVFVETQSGVHAIAFEFGGKRTDMNVDLRENSAVRITLNRESGEVAARVLSLEGIRS